MISWATIRDGDIDSAGRSDGQTEEAAVHAYRSQYGEALNLILKGQLAPSRLILNQILSDMEASRFKDVQIKFLTLANLSRVYEREHNMTEAYIAILHAAELNPGDANIITRAALLGSQLGDTWTSRALLNCEAFRQGGMLCMEELILDNCTKVYQDQFQSLPTLRKCMQVTLTVYSDECDLRSFVEQLCCAELWQCDEVIIQRVSAASRSLLDSAAIDITDAADVSRSDHSSGVMGIETAQQTMAMAGILGCALGVDGDSNSISTPPNEANKSEAANTRRSKRNSSKFTENSNGVPKAVGLVENIEAVLRKLCESQKLPQSSLQSPAMPSGEIFANLLKRLLADSEEDVQLAALSTRSAPVKSCHESYALTANILESVSQVRKRLCYGDERVVNRLKLALDIFHALAADAVRCVSFTISDGVSGTDSGPPIKSKAPDWVLLNSALLQLWPVVANNYAIDYGSLGLAALLQDIPEASAVFLGECVLDYTLQQGGVTHVDTVWTSTLEFLYWRWLQAMQNASQSSLPGCVLTDLIKLKIRRDWIVLQYEMVLASAAKPDRSIDSLLHASDLLKDIILTRTYVVCIPYLSEKMDTVKTSTVSCIGKMSPARELLLELNQTTFAAVYDDSEMELLKDRLDRAAYIYDTCHDLSSMLGSLKKYYAAECRDGLEMDPEPLLFLRYLTLLRDSRCERGLQDRFLGALDRVYSLMWRDLHSNIKENLLDDAEKEVEALSMWAVPLLRDLFGDKKAEIQNLIDYDINNFNGKKFMRIFRRISFFALVATRYIGVSPVSSLCLLCIELLGCLASFPLSDRLPHGSIQYLVEISIGLCLHFWKTDRDKGNNGAVKGIRRGLICAFADLIKTAIFDPPRPNAFIMGKYFSSLSKWIFCSSCTDEMHTYNIFNFLIESFSMFATLKKSLPKTDLGSISCAIEINQYACILITMELIYALLCKQDSDDQDIDIGEIVYAFCACIMEMSTNQFFTMADGALQVDILHRLLCVVYHSEACVDLIGARILTAASSTEDPDFIKCAALMDLQDHVTDSPLHAVCEAIAQLCSSLYKFPDLGQNSIPLETLAISNNSSRISSLDLVLPSHLIPGVFIFLKFWDDCYVTLPRATWGLCFTQMYKSMCLRCPPISQRATSFHAYLFEPLKDAMGERGELGGLFESDQDLLDRAKDTCIYVIALDRIKQNNLNQDNATADEILLDWVRSDFYEKYQSCGCVVSIKSDKSHTEANAFSRARKSGDVTISAVENVDYYFNFVCDAEAKNCPALTLALQCLCHSYELEGQYDSLVRIANGLYELASAALDEMTSYCFPINAVADDYIPVHIFDGSDHPNCTLENILSGIFAAVPFGNFPSILSLLCDPVTASKDVMKGVNELFDGQISTLDYQHIEEAVLWGSRPTPCPGFSYSASVIFLCRYHKSVMHLFDKVYSLFFTMYFRKHIVSQNLVLSSEQITELVKFVVSPGTGCAVVPADTADEDLVGGIGSEDFSSSAKTALSKATISMTEMKVILESHLAVILKNHEEQKIECFKRAMKHALQGLGVSKYFGISNMFLPIFAAEVGHELNLPVEPIHLLLYAAEAASRLPAVEKKVRVHVVFNYHNIRLERSWNWIKICYGINPVASYEDAPTSSSPGTRSTPGSLPRDVFDYLSNDLHILDGYKVSSLNCLPGTAAINAMYFPSPFQLTTEIKSKFVQNGARDRVDSKTNLLSLSASCSPPSRSAEHGTHCEHLMSRLWIIILESIAGLKHCRKLDNFDCKAVYALSNFLSTLISLPGVLIPDQVLESLNSIGLNVSYFSAAEMAWKMFEKRRPTMIVALWREDKGKANRFDQVMQRQYCFDGLRMQYVDCFLRSVRHAGISHVKQLCDLTLTSLTISELSPVMLLITRRCISTFTEILSRLNDSHFFLAPPEAAADGIEATSNMSHNVNRDSFSLLNACDIYEASLLKAKTGALSPHFCYDLLTVLVDTIKSSQLFVPSQDSGDCNVYSSTSQSNAHSEEILFPNFQVLRQYLKQWMETKGRNLGDFGKKNSIKRHRVLKPTSTKTVSSIEADISTVTGTHANDAVGPSVNISFADNILSSADVEVYSDEADSGSDEKRRRIDEYNDLNLSLDHEN